MLTSEQIREKFLNFWASSPRNSKLIPNMSLIPNTDSTLLFVNSGMFPLAPYLAGQPHPLGTRLTNIQRCLRTNYDEMIEIGDNRHTSMFEMMGDWSLGDYFKKEQIPWIMELHIQHYGLDPSRLYVTVFKGDLDALRDDESISLWIKAFKTYGIDADYTEDITLIPKSINESKNHKFRIFPFEKRKNWWERAHLPGELGGPTSEMFYDLGTVQKKQDEYHINDDSGRFIEIGNNVFMEYRLNSEMKWEKLPQSNVDFGGGFERIVMIIQNKTDIFETDIYSSIINTIEKLSNKKYKDNNQENEFTSSFRIIADHARAATFILADGVNVSNKDQGYILRRFIRRLIRYGKKLGIENNFTKKVVETVIERMKDVYPHLKTNQEDILNQFEKEENTFRQTLNRGLKQIQLIKEKYQENLFTLNHKENDKDVTESSLNLINGEQAFYIYETYGFPLELTLDELEINEDLAKIIEVEFKKEELKHREISRLGAEHKFKGGLADQSIETTKLHTVHHLLLSALQKIVDSNIKQKGSNITSERLRIDFNLNRKVSDEEIKKIEELVNNVISKEIPVLRKEMSKDQAERLGAQMEFGQKYGDIVSVYFITDNGEDFSVEFCGGPHVKNTKELKEGDKKFKIIKEESSGAGIRRIKATLK